MSDTFDFLVDYGTDKQAKTEQGNHELLRDLVGAATRVVSPVCGRCSLRPPHVPPAAQAVLKDDARTGKRSVTDMQWSPSHSELLAVSYGSLDVPGQSSSSSAVDGLVLVWSSVMLSVSGELAHHLLLLRLSLLFRFGEFAAGIWPPPLYVTRFVVSHTHTHTLS